MVTVNGLRAAAKRTAFGDVSNTARNPQSSKDDSVLNGKTAIQVGGKASFAPLEKKPVALLRPAQRPLSVSGIKGLLNGTSSTSTSAAATTTTTTTTNNASSAAQHPLPVAQSVVPQIVSRKNTVKRTTTIFKDSAAYENDHPATTVPLKEIHNQAPMPPVHQNLAPIPPVHQTLAPRHHKSQPYLRAEKPVLRKTQSKFFRPSTEADKENSFAGLSILSSDVIQPPAEENETTYHDVEEYRPYHYADIAPTVDVQANHDYPTPELSQHELKQRATQRLVEEHDREAEEDLKAKADAANELLAVAELTEPEEYWDDELDDEIYEDDGYTTARSCYSRGDNTTGGATTVLMPKMTNKVRKEIAAAKEIVESSRTLEEVLDESFDSTMVTEYGDEIFQYMRDLEVSWPCG